MIGTSFIKSEDKLCRTSNTIPCKIIHLNNVLEFLNVFLVRHVNFLNFRSPFFNSLRRRIGSQTLCHPYIIIKSWYIYFYVSESNLLFEREFYVDEYETSLFIQKFYLFSPWY